MPEKSQGQPSALMAGSAIRVIVAVATTSLLLTACNENDPNGALTSYSNDRQLSVAGTVRPSLDHSVMEKVKKEEAEAFERKRQEVIAAQKAEDAQNQAQFQSNTNSSTDPAQRDLPPVDTSPLGGLANMLGMGGTQNHNQTPGAPPSTQPPPPQSIASYGGYGQPQGGSLIPPPPAISVSATSIPPPQDAYNPYGGGYAPQPYGYPPPQYAYPPQQAAQPAAPSHPEGSFFSNGGTGGGGGDATAVRRKEVVLITPTGMESRSVYKQRDDLKVLIKGALAYDRELRDDRIQQSLRTVDVSLPSESTKGNLSLTQRQIDKLFTTPSVDKRILPHVKKVETELAQGYYRFLYAFNKFALMQQQVAARKQEVEVADTNSEKQRAASDLASAQHEFDTSKDDLHAAEVDLAQISGGGAARNVITKVTGQSPSLDALAAGDNDASSDASGQGIMQALNPMNVLNVFNRKGGGSAPRPSSDSNEERPTFDSKKVAKKGGGTSLVRSSPPPSDSDSSPPEKPEKPAPTVASTGVSFELKNVTTTPRKSILSVAIKNNGNNNINIDSDAIYVVDGDHRLAEASVSAEFDTSLVEPNQEVTGTITIFGRPWNDKLTVSLSEGGKTIQLHR